MKDINFDSDKDFETRAIALKDQMLKLNLADPNLVRGCSKKEIEKLEQDNNVILPKSYRVFLENFGHGIGGAIMKEIDILYDNIFNLTNVIRNEVLIDEGDPVLPNKAFVFTGRYNEQFMFFNADGLEEDPSVFYYMIDDEEFRKIADSIFDIVEDEVEVALSIKHYRERNKKPDKN